METDKFLTEISKLEARDIEFSDDDDFFGFADEEHDFQSNDDAESQSKIDQTLTEAEIKAAE